uniref:Ig-like domain-containing protein n=1 Tax=Callorhinchus milii TaxID=7868 RepID=A0A4W3HS01_CALMI
MMSMLKMLKIIGIYVLFGLSFETQQIEGVMNVTAVKGYEAILQCEAPGKSSNKPVQFQVNKEDNNTMIAIYNPPVNKILNSSYKLRATLEVTENSVTIIIKEAQESDKGWYSCQVHTFPGGKVVQKIYLDIKVSIAGAVAVAVILAMVIWKVKKKTLPKNKQIPYNDDPIYANCDYTPHKVSIMDNKHKLPSKH